MRPALVVVCPVVNSQTSELRWSFGAWRPVWTAMCMALLACAGALGLLSLGAVPALAQVTARVTQPVDAKVVVALKGNVHPLARAEFDRGAAPDSLPMDRMLLVLKKSDQQEAALRKLLDDQQDKNSKSYRQWLTPDEFGAQFGIADSDLAKVMAWLQAAGFQNIKPSRGRTIIEFSGTAGQVRAAFATSIHKYVVNGKEHWANSSEISIPAALEPVVAGVFTLHNFLKAPQIQMSPEKFTAVKGKPGARPMFTSSKGVHAMIPADFQTIYGFSIAQQPEITSKIAVVARSDVDSGDMANNEEVLGSPQFLTTIQNGPDPGILSGDEQAEATLDVVWAGGATHSATIIQVVSMSTAVTDGADLSEAFIIDNNVADVMTESFGGCEAQVSSAEAQGISNLAEQAAAEGISYVVASGDSGAAGCDDPHSETAATQANSVNVLASTAYTVAVGGTMFNDTSTAANYWSATNSQGESALGYIPENVWNESCQSGQAGCAKANIAAGGGGASMYVSKPSWQAGVAGIPTDGKRDLPDVAFSAAGHDPYLICLNGSCANWNSGTYSFAGVAGTSASTPAFAGIVALVDTVQQTRIGAPNYVLYKLAAAENLANCNASSTTATIGSGCVFNDVTVGNNAVPGETGYGTAGAQYQAGTGYDLATGLGSVHISNLVSQWNSVSFTPSATAFTMSPTTATHGDPLTVTITVTPGSGSGTPTGSAWLWNGPAGYSVEKPLLSDLVFPLSNGTFSGTIHDIGGGTYNVWAHYAGDQTYGGSDSPSTQITINPEPSVVTLQVGSVGSGGVISPVTSVVYGTSLFYKIHVTGASGYGRGLGPVSVETSPTTGWQMPGPDPSGTSSLDYGQAPVGNNSLTAYFGGDNSLNSGTSAPVALTVTQAASSTVMTVTQNADAAGTPIVSYIVNAQGSGYAPTGTVTIYAGSTVLVPGGPLMVGGTPGNPQGTGGANLYGLLGPGNYNLTAVYSGDANYTGSTSPPVPLSLVAGFSIQSFGNVSEAVAAGQQVSFVNAISITQQNGFTGTVNLTCSLPAAAIGAGCTVNPAMITLGGGGSASVIVTTLARSGVSPIGELKRFPPSGFLGLMASLISLMAGAWMAFVGPGKRRRLGWAMGVIGMVVLGLGACGGGTGASSPPPQQGTPTGQYTVTVTGTSGSISHSTTLTLQVN